MENKKVSLTHQMHLDSAKAVKEHFSLRDFNYEYDIAKLILTVKAMRTAQKKYFAGAGTAQKQELLIDAKQKELQLEKFCNELWSKHNLKNTISRY